MHRSRLVGFVIDCQGGDIDAHTRFWSEALGRPIERVEKDFPTYRQLKMREDEPLMLVQTVDHPSRVHIDIESTDVDAEADRLEKLGAKRLQKIRTWWVMEAPSGHRFCVVRKQTDRLATEGNEWP